LPSEAGQYLAVLLPRARQFFWIDPEGVEDRGSDLTSLHIIVDGRRSDSRVPNEKADVAVVLGEAAVLGEF